MADANGTLIKMEGVKKVFLTDEVETHALSEIHLEIKKGTYISIAGPSGCGKSTLLSILGLLDSPSDGSYMLNGQPVSKLSISERTRIRNREIGFIFQAFNLIGDLTVYENVELPLTYRGTSAARTLRSVPSTCSTGASSKKHRKHASGPDTRRIFCTQSGRTFATARACCGSTGWRRWSASWPWRWELARTRRCSAWRRRSC